MLPHVPVSSAIASICQPKSEPLTATLFISGLMQLFTLTTNAATVYFPDEVQWLVDRWGLPHSPSESVAHWPTDALGGTRPIACHSHNDYWHDVPLYSAIQAGCTSVEADIWLFDQEIYVGHTTASLTAERTLRRLYLDPLLDLVNQTNHKTRFTQAESSLNGVFEADPEQTLVLLVDFKTDGHELWSELMNQLSPLREAGYLTQFNGTDVVERPITVVGSGYVPFDLVVANTTHRDIFCDAPLDRLSDTSAKWPNPNRLTDEQKSQNNALVFNPDVAGLRPKWSKALADNTPHATNQPLEEYSRNNSYLASVSFTRSIGYVWGSRLSQAQLQLLRAQIRGAHERGLRVRYWGLPYWPTGLRNHVWHILIREGVDVLSVDDLVGATQRDWRKSKGWWY